MHSLYSQWVLSSVIYIISITSFHDKSHYTKNIQNYESSQHQFKVEFSGSYFSAFTALSVMSAPEILSNYKSFP